MRNHLNLRPFGGAIFAIALLGGSAVMTTPASAQGAWCADQGGRNAYTNCGYYTLQQCQAAVSGVGGYCRPNAMFAPYPGYENYGYVEQAPRRGRYYR
jgi:hypothetical protein